MTNLPFDEAWPEIENAIQRHVNLVIVAEPGAGKTTRLPPGLIQRNLVSGKVVVLEPRRIAARAAALRVAEEGFLRLPEDVGYAVRFDNKTKPTTQLTYLTEGLFFRKLMQDPKLEGIEAVVLDEFHERSRYTDLAIAALRELQLLERPDLRIIVMSATLDSELVSRFLSVQDIAAPIVSVPGRTFPVDVYNALQPLRLVTDRNWVDSLSSDLKAIATGRFQIGERTLAKRTDDILVFLPGTGEIRRLKENLTASLENFEVLELHGSLSLEEQARVLKPHTAQRRIILATNIAETSLTLDGVGTVVDTGLERSLDVDRLGFSSLNLGRITLASAKQRAGRAGRLGPGVAIRMWSKMDELSFRPFAQAEILNLDLIDTVLEISGLGNFDVQSFSWFEAPAEEKLNLAIATLIDLEALDENQRITALGKRILQSGLPCRAGRLLLESERIKDPSAKALAASLAAIITERDFVMDRSANSASSVECDLYVRHHLLSLSENELRTTARKIDHQLRKTVIKARDLHLQTVKGESRYELWNEEIVTQLLLAGYPDRVARRRRVGLPTARMVGGRGVELHSATSLQNAEIFFAIRGDAGVSRTSGDPIVTLASPIDLNTLRTLRNAEFRKGVETLFDSETLSVYGLRSTYYRDLPLDEGTREAPDPEKVLEILKSEFLKRKERFEDQAAIRTWLNRVEFARKSERTLENAESDLKMQEALALTSEELFFNKKSLQEFFTDEGSERFATTWERTVANLDSKFAQSLEKLAPSHFQAPTGNRFRIQYPSDQTPFVAVRLQELFGTKENPKVGGTNLTFHLLGPNYRPVQVTSDLPGFWKGSYFEVRKELRARYPKHSWPENPLEAPAVAKGRPQK